MWEGRRAGHSLTIAPIEYMTCVLFILIKWMNKWKETGIFFSYKSRPHKLKPQCWWLVYLLIFAKLYELFLALTVTHKNGYKQLALMPYLMNECKLERRSVRSNRLASPSSVPLKMTNRTRASVVCRLMNSITVSEFWITLMTPPLVITQ